MCSFVKYPESVITPCNGAITVAMFFALAPTKSTATPFVTANPRPAIFADKSVLPLALATSPTAPVPIINAPATCMAIPAEEPFMLTASKAFPAKVPFIPKSLLSTLPKAATAPPVATNPKLVKTGFFSPRDIHELNRCAFSAFHPSPNPLQKPLACFTCPLLYALVAREPNFVIPFARAPIKRALFQSVVSSPAKRRYFIVFGSTIRPVSGSTRSAPAINNPVSASRDKSFIAVLPE